MTLGGTQLENILDQVGEAGGLWDRVRKEAEVGARKATRTPLLVVGSIAVAGAVLAVLALLRR